MGYKIRKKTKISTNQRQKYLTAETPKTQNNPPNQVMSDITLKVLTAPDLTQQPLCITAEALGDANVSLKSGLIHHLPTFEGILDDPNKFLLDFYLVYSSMKQGTTTAEQLMLKAFPFALKGTAKDWATLSSHCFYHKLADFEASLLGKVFYGFSSLHS